MKHENNLVENESNKNLIINLKKEISSLNNIIKDYKSQLDVLLLKEQNAQGTINTLQNEILSKEYIINDNKIKNEQNVKDNLQNKIVINDLENKNKSLTYNINEMKQKNEELINNLEIIKENNLKEMNKYEEIIKQKDIQIKRISQECNNSKQHLEKMLELQRKITELKIENNKLFLKIQEYEKNKVENELLMAKKQNNLLISFKDKSDTIKDAYQDLIAENEQLKNNIITLRETHD